MGRNQSWFHARYPVLVIVELRQQLRFFSFDAHLLYCLDRPNIRWMEMQHRKVAPSVRYLYLLSSRPTVSRQLCWLIRHSTGFIRKNEKDIFNIVYIRENNHSKTLKWKAHKPTASTSQTQSFQSQTYVTMLEGLGSSFSRML